MATTTRSQRYIHAPPERVYRLLVDAEAVRRWKVPQGMTSQVHAFDARIGGAFRVSLTYDAAQAPGKTGGPTDTYHGRFVSLVPHALVIERMEFETTQPSLSGEMTVTYHLMPSGTGTDLIALHEGVPDGVSPADNALGWRMAFDRLAALAEAPDAS